MVATPIQSAFVASNNNYAAAFTQGDLPLPPAKKYLVLTCMDARLDPAAAFGIPVGDAHVVRNAGGSARDAYRSIIVSQQLLATREVLLVKHTDCGMLTFTTDVARGLVASNIGPEAAEEVKDLDFLTFPDLEVAVREDVDWLKSKKSVPDDVPITGWIYDVRSGKVSQVV